jgi:hypothetical protein
VCGGESLLVGHAQVLHAAGVAAHDLHTRGVALRGGLVQGGVAVRTVVGPQQVRGRRHAAQEGGALRQAVLAGVVQR